MRRRAANFAPSTGSGLAPGFSFTEVLFAVMILGIGFIMVAAIFPVAIQQAKTSAEETTGGAVARGGANYLERIASNSTMPATENVVVGPDYDGRPPYPSAGSTFPLPGTDGDSDGITVATALRGSLVVAGDGRYGWLPLYRRAGNPADPTTWSPFAQVFMIPVMVRNKSEYRSENVRMAGGPLVAASKTGVVGTARIVGDIIDGLNGAPDVINFKSDFDVLSEGAFVVVADARRGVNASTGAAPTNSSWNTVVAPQLHGRIYRLGNPDPTDTDTPPHRWQLMPGFDFEPVRMDLDNNRTNGVPPNRNDGKETLVGSAATPIANATFFVVGRGLSAADRTGNTREGAAQDVTAYTTFVTVK